MSGRKAAALYRGRRNPRFVTLRRAGSLADETHRLLPLWAADCTHHVLTYFAAQRPADDRPRHAVEVARQRARLGVTMVAAREAAYAAHAAARDTTGAASHSPRRGYRTHGRP